MLVNTIRVLNNVVYFPYWMVIFQQSQLMGLTFPNQFKLVASFCTRNAQLD